LSDIERTDLRRYLDVTRAEMVLATGVILGEGTTGQFLVPAFAEGLQDDEKRLFRQDREIAARP
jgi:predicted ATP-dependent endonuclease of OLD family